MLFSTADLLIYISTVVILILVLLAYIFIHKIGITPFTIFLFFLIPPYLLYPVAYKGYNALIGNADASFVVGSINKAMHISTLAIFTFLISYFVLARLIINETIIKIRRVSYNNEKILNVFIFLSVFGILGMIFVYSYTGWVPLLKMALEKYTSVIARSFFYVYEKYERVRPIYNLSMRLIKYALIYLLLALTFEKQLFKSRFKIFFTEIICVVGLGMLLSTGSRSFVMYALLGYIAVYSGINYKKIGLLNLFNYAAGLTLLLIILGVFRGAFSHNVLVSIKSIVNEFLYGNTFSDLRDFSWILYNFEKGGSHFLLGKTFISGLLTFIPSAILPFRQSYTWGRFSAEIGGFDVAKHFGLRTFTLTEWYFNFSYIGMIIAIIIYSIVLYKIERNYILNCKIYKAERGVWSIYKFYIYSNMAVSIIGSTGFYDFYILLFMVLLLLPYQRKTIEIQDINTKLENQ